VESFLWQVHTRVIVVVVLYFRGLGIKYHMVFIRMFAIPKFPWKFSYCCFLPLVLPSSTSVPVTSEVQSREVLISWDLPQSDGGSPITHYIVESRVAAIHGTFPVQAGANWITAINGVSNSETSVPSLRPFTRYQFRVIAVNIAGRGPPSSPTDAITTLEAGK